MIIIIISIINYLYLLMLIKVKILNIKLNWLNMVINNWKIFFLFNRNMRIFILLVRI